MAKTVRSLQTKHDPSSRIIVLGEITTEFTNEVIKSIYEINREDEKKKADKIEPIKLIMNSPGGDLYSGLALIDVIRTSITPIHITGHGSIMSMALIVYAAGHYRIASKNATFMYHEAHYGMEGKVKHHRQELKEIQRTEDICNKILLSTTKLTQPQLEDIIIKGDDWFFDVEQAYKLGIVDEII